MKYNVDGFPDVAYSDGQKDIDTLNEIVNMVADELGIEASEVDPLLVAEYYRDGGFAEWPPEKASRTVRALAHHSGLEHI